MERSSITEALTPERRRQLLDQLNEDSLSALMRSTWTWDDRALRRELSKILVDLSAARELRTGGFDCPESVVEAVENRVLATAGEFVAEVLGPRLLVDAGNPLRAEFLPLVSMASDFEWAADRALEAIAVEVTGEVIERNESISTILPESDWEEKAFEPSALTLAQVAYSAGYTLSPTDYFPSAGLATQAFRIAADPSQESVDLRHSTLAAAEVTGSWDPAMVRTQATREGDQWKITGDKYYVPGASEARTFLVIARTIGGPSLYVVEREAPGVVVTPLESLDPSRQLSKVTFEDAPATMIGREGAGGRVMNRTVDSATTALAAEQMGIVDRALKSLSELPPSCNDNESWGRYTREVASMEVLRWSATALCFRAVRLQGGDDLHATAVAAAMAHVGCSSAVRHVALRLQTPGVTELDADTIRSITDRARGTDLLLGGPSLAYERLLERMGI